MTEAPISGMFYDYDTSKAGLIHQMDGLVSSPLRHLK